MFGDVFRLLQRTRAAPARRQDRERGVNKLTIKFNERNAGTVGHIGAIWLQRIGALNSLRELNVVCLKQWLYID